jgi:hypothetical protein
MVLQQQMLQFAKLYESASLCQKKDWKSDLFIYAASLNKLCSQFSLF